MLIFIPMLVQR